MEKDGPSKWLWTPLRAYETDTISGLLTLSFKLRAAERERTWKLGFPINISAILLPQQSSYLPLPLRLSPVAIGPYCNSPLSTSPSNYQVTHSAHLLPPAGPGLVTLHDHCSPSRKQSFFLPALGKHCLFSRSSSFHWFFVFSSYLLFKHFCLSLPPTLT